MPTNDMLCFLKEVGIELECFRGFCCNLPPPSPIPFDLFSGSRVLRVINERLQGRYNLTVPRPSGRGTADAGNDLPLSVREQEKNDGTLDPFYFVCGSHAQNIHTHIYIHSRHDAKADG